MRHIKRTIFCIIIIAITTTKVVALNTMHTLDNQDFSQYADVLKKTETCYYMEDNFKVKLQVNTGKLYAGIGKTNDDYTDIYINKVGDKPQNNPESVLNWIEGSWHSHTTTGTKPVKFSGLYEDEKDASENGTCPTYLILQSCKTYKIWGVNGEENQKIAEQAVESINSNPKCKGYIATYEHSDGTKITADDYYGSFVHKDLGGEEINELTCYGENSLFGDKEDKGIEIDGKTIKPPSLAYMIDSALTYVRILVPILIILLGTIDLAKAVLASDEDKMKKAQKDFIKRLLMGVVVFFVPTIVNIIMKLADVLWEGTGYNPCLLP